MATPWFSKQCNSLGHGARQVNRDIWYCDLRNTDDHDWESHIPDQPTDVSYRTGEDRITSSPGQLSCQPGHGTDPCQADLSVNVQKPTPKTIELAVNTVAQRVTS